MVLEDRHSVRFERYLIFPHLSVEELKTKYWDFLDETIYGERKPRVVPRETMRKFKRIEGFVEKVPDVDAPHNSGLCYSIRRLENESWEDAEEKRDRHYSAFCEQIL